jgi:hypothetical protein
MDGIDPGAPGVRAQMQRLIYGFFTSQVLYVAARLEIPDVLAAGPQTTAEVAAATKAHPPSLYRLLRALAYLGIAEQRGPDTFALTERGELLRSDTIGSLRELVMLLAGPESWRAWGHLEHAVRTGEVAWDRAFGENTFDYLAARADRQAGFNAAMAEGSRAFVPTLLAACDFTAYARVVDVGGGSGALLAGVLAAHPRMRGVVFDTPAGVADAPAELAAAGVADRCEVVAGDFFRTVPTGGDAYLLKSVLHDWDDDRCVAILASCRRAMAAHAELIVIESVMPAVVDGAANLAQLVMNDLNMMVCHGGRERTVPEFSALLNAAGLRLQAVSPCAAPSTVAILTATPSS